MFEISASPISPLEGVDAWVYTRETIKTFFPKHDIIASMHPSPTTDYVYDNDVETHLSISQSVETALSADPNAVSTVA